MILLKVSKMRRTYHYLEDQEMKKVLPLKYLELKRMWVKEAIFNEYRDLPEYLRVQVYFCRLKQGTHVLSARNALTRMKKEMKRLKIPLAPWSERLPRSPKTHDVTWFEPHSTSVAGFTWFRLERQSQQRRPQWGHFNFAPLHKLLFVFNCYGEGDGRGVGVQVFARRK